MRIGQYKSYFFMSGLGAATGKYFKVVDSDDWLDKSSLEKIMETLWNWEKDGTEVDMLLANYVYEKVGATRKKVVHYRNALPQNQVFSWDETSHFRVGQYILMHSVIYRTDLLRECGLTLPKHTFYVDNIYVYYPLPHVKTMYYIDTNLYRYFIGREDQSVNEAVMVGRVDQQIFVTKTMIDMSDVTQQKELDFELQRYRVALSGSGQRHDTILIIDDQEINRAILNEIFHESFTILEAENGRVGMRTLWYSQKKETRITLKSIDGRRNREEILILTNVFTSTMELN